MRRNGWPNPGAVGTFPKVLGDYVRGRRALTLEQAVARMTSESCARFGITDRGTLAPGQKADVVVFDPETIVDTPPRGGEPAGRPKGIDRVYVNGTEVVRGGAYHEGVRAGHVLRA